MNRLRTSLALLAIACTFVATLGPSIASAGDSVGDRYRSYSLLRERLRSCSLDRSWHHLGQGARKRCRTLRRQYVLYSINGESSEFFVHCRRSAPRCPAAPDGVRDPRLPVPRGATVFR